MLSFFNANKPSSLIHCHYKPTAFIILQLEFEWTNELFCICVKYLLNTKLSKCLNGIVLLNFSVEMFVVTGE